jgi:hypothetical protein
MTKYKNHYTEYLGQQLKDPEFAAHYSLAREKVRLEIYLDKLKENIKADVDKKTIIRNINKIKKYVNQIAF